MPDYELTSAASGAALDALLMRAALSVQPVDIGVSAAASRRPLIATQTFVGNGSSQTVNFGFRPDFLIVRKESDPAVFFHPMTWRRRSAHLGLNSAHATTEGVEFTATGCVIPSVDRLNESGETTYIIAFADNGSGMIEYGGYKGDSETDNKVYTSHTPHLVIIKRDNVSDAIFAYTGSATTYSFRTTVVGNVITLDSDGFTVHVSTDGTDDPTNDSGGEGYDWISFSANSDYLSIVEYVGNGTSQSISAGFLPDLALVKRLTSNTAAFFKSADQETTASFNISGGASNTTAITGLTNTGITVGASVFANQGSSDHVAIMFRGSRAHVEPSGFSVANRSVLDLPDGGVLIEESDDFNLTGSQTWEFLLQIQALTTDESWIFSRASAPANVQIGLLLNSAAQDSDLMVINGSASARWRTGVRVLAGETAVIHWVFDATAQRQFLYLNGKLARFTNGDGSNLVDLSALTIASATTGYRVAFNGVNDAGSVSASNRSDIKYGNVAVWTRALSSAEVLARTVGLSKNVDEAPRDYLEQWAFCDSYGTRLQASVDSAHNGVIISGAWSTFQ